MLIVTSGPHWVEIVIDAPVPFPKHRTSSVTLPVNNFPSGEMLVIEPVFPGIACSYTKAYATGSGIRVWTTMRSGSTSCHASDCCYCIDANSIN